MSSRWIFCLLLLLSATVYAGGPVATVRVAFDRDGITATRVHGFADKTTSRKVTADDPVRIASISKLDTAHAPGTYFRYTNLNFPLVAQLMERATGERFDKRMRRISAAAGCSGSHIYVAVPLSTMR